MRRAFAALACASALVFTPGCSVIGDIASIFTGHSDNPPSINGLADAPLDVQAFAVIAAWAELQEQALVVLESPVAPEALKQVIRDTSATTAPLMIALSEMAESYGDARMAGSLPSTGADPLRLSVTTQEASISVDRLRALIDIERALVSGEAVQ